MKNWAFSLVVLTVFINFIRADVKSLTGQIKFDTNSNGTSEAILDSNGLQIGAVTGTANLNLAGNAIVTTQLSIGENTSLSNLHINGTWSKSIVTVTGNSEIPNSSIVLLNLSSSAANVDLTLPPAGNVANQVMNIKMTSGSVEANIRALEGIDNAFRITLGPLSSSVLPTKVKLYSTGSEWYILSSFDNSSGNALVSLSDNLIAHWPFDENEGLVAHDVSGSGHHATIQGRDDVVWQTGQVDGSVYLDGDNEFFFAGDEIVLNDTNFSITYWEKFASTGASRFVVGQGYNTGNRGLHIGYRPTNRVRFAFYSNDIDTTESYISTEWRHWTFTYDRSIPERKIYVNGVLTTTNTPGGAYAPINQAMYLGADYNASNSFHGNLDDIRIYNTVLNSEQAEELYLTSGFSSPPVISAAVAKDVNNSEGVGVGDTLTLTFSEGTNEPNVGSKSDLDVLFDWNTKSLGSDYNGVWSDNTTLVITVVDSTGADIEVGDLVKIKQQSSFTHTTDGGLWVHGKVSVTGLFSWFDFSDSLVAHYTFDHTIENYLFDAVGNTHLFISGNSTYAPTGIVGQAFNVDGSTFATGEGVDIADQDSTIMFWEKRSTTISTTQSLFRVGSEDSNNNQIRLKYESSDKFNFDLYGTSQATAQTFTTQVWRHWAYTYDDTLGTQRLYLNGNLIRSESSNSYRFAGDDVVYLGAKGSSSEMYSGTMDDVRVYNRILSADEINQIVVNTENLIVTPNLAIAMASDPESDFDELTNGDNLTLTFTYPTNMPSASNKAEIDNLVDFGNYSLGTDYSGTWQDNTTLALTVIDATGGNLQVGGNVNILESGNLTNSEGTSGNSRTVGVSVTGSWGFVAASNVMAYYPLNQSTGTVVTDIVNGRDGEFDGGMDDSNWVVARSGNGLELDGSTDDFYVGSGNFSLANQSFTFSIWEKRGSEGSDDWLYSQGTSSANLGLHFGYRSSNVFALGFWSNDLNSSAYTGTGNWRHWVLSYDAPNKTQAIYHNGVLITSRNTTYDYQGTGTLYVGSRFGGANYDGTIDDVLIYDRPLTELEVKALYEQ